MKKETNKKGATPKKENNKKRATRGKLKSKISPAISKAKKSTKKAVDFSPKAKKPTKKVAVPKDKMLKVIFLGGVGEIGKNMTVLEYGKDIIVIDAGVTFPGENMPGVDLVIQDATYLIQNKDRVRGIIVTHGHEDHIGSLPYLLKDLNVPVYATKLTLTLIENKLIEHKIDGGVLNCIKAGGNIKLGAFNIECINVNHSIAGALGFSITTPVGVVFFTGDFKIDFTPVGGQTTDLTRIGEIGEKGVLLLMAESTNVEREGITMSESVVKETLDHLFADNASRRLVIATFASNVHRLQQILDLAVKHKRKVAFSGRSMINIAEAASKIGELNIPKNLIFDIEKINSFKDKEVLIITTGTQGEPMSALTRMASGEFNKVTIGQNDTVVISASVIPGNEKMIYGVINNLYRLGAKVIYESLEPIHVSGHACKGELSIIHSLIKPKFFIQVHGEYRHLKEHTLLAQSLGMKEHNTLIAEIGDAICFTKDTMTRGEKVPSGSMYVDGVGIDGADSFVLRDRIHLSEDGIIVVVVSVGEYTAQLTSVEIVSKGINFTDAMNIEAKASVINTLSQIDLRKVKDEAELSQIIRRSVKNYIFRATKKNPMILPVVMVV